MYQSFVHDNGKALESNAQVAMCVAHAHRTLVAPDTWLIDTI